VSSSLGVFLVFYLPAPIADAVGGFSQPRFMFFRMSPSAVGEIGYVNIISQKSHPVYKLRYWHRRTIYHLSKNVMYPALICHISRLLWI